MHSREAFFLMPELDGLLTRFAESLGSAGIQDHLELDVLLAGLHRQDTRLLTEHME